jgi:hypothetical protein
MKLLETVKSLILETVTDRDIRDAISQRKVIYINYNGDEPGGKGLRKIEPVCLGVNTLNHPVLSAWELDGASHRGYLKTRPMPGWRYFLVKDILSVTPTDDVFTEVRPGFNPNGDKRMISIDILANFT